MADMKIKGTLVLKDGLQRDGIMEVEKGVITAVYPAVKSSGKVDYDFTGHYVGPGFIDIHIHGALGKGFARCGSENYPLILDHCAAHGTTSVLAGIATSAKEVVDTALSSIKRYISDTQAKEAVTAKILGAHLEGPFLSPAVPGAMESSLIVPPSIAQYKQWEETGIVKMITIAPEVEGAKELIEYIFSKSCVIISAGHTKASYEQMNEAASWGVDHLTHFYNAMTGLKHREPGVAGAGLFNPALTIELISDFIHVHPIMITLALRIKGINGICLVTDSVELAGMPNGVYRDGNGVQRIVDDSKLTTATGALAGSSHTMDMAVHNLVACGAGVWEAWQMASHNPAKKLGLDDRLGVIIPGALADLAVLDDSLTCVAAAIEGQWLKKKKM